MVAFSFDYTSCGPQGQRVVYERGLGANVEREDAQSQYWHPILWSPYGMCKRRAGFAFVDRQKHITTDSEDFYIDLVFYNIKLKRYVLFELKTHPLTHSDVGQLDMYVRMYDDLVKDENDNPTIGILLCTETDKVMAKYSVLNGSEQLFAAKYMSYMPTEEELRREIEQQKRFFMEQHGQKDI